MSQKDGSQGDPVKDFQGKSNILKKFHSIKDQIKYFVKKKAAKVADSFESRITDLRIEKISKLSEAAKRRIIAGALGAVALGAVAIGAALYLNAGPDVYKLTIAGGEAGYLTDTGLVPKAIEEIKADFSERTNGAEIIVDDKAIVLEVADVKAKKVKLLTGEQVKERILSADLVKASAWAVNINGSNVASVLTEADANSVLDEVKRHYLTEGAEIISAEFKEDVTVTRAAFIPSDIMTVEEAVKLIVTGTKEPKVYTVQNGDTMWDIAAANGMSVAELQSANPGFNPNRLKIGQQLNLFEVKPYVTVLTKEIVTATEKIDYKTVYENTNTLYKGEVKVKTPGVYGKREVRTELIKENGVVVASTELGSVVTAEPQNQVALKGTKSIATFTGSGTLSSPVARIEISSAYGVNRGSSRHTGVDFRNPKGTPILAADDGVVIAVTSGGSPGKMVKLSHGNGLETWYEHCDTILVSVGQVVKKGEQIATVGRTGNATGYHLHFEVRKNGAPQNPMNYL